MAYSSWSCLSIIRVSLWVKISRQNSILQDHIAIPYVMLIPFIRFVFAFRGCHVDDAGNAQIHQ